MAGNKEIRNKIKSVQNTRKITKAMEMVAASKMRKAQDRMHSARPYAEKIRHMVMRLIEATHHDYMHPFMKPLSTSAQKVAVIAVSTDKGLCGGLNTNAFRLLNAQIREWQSRQIKTTFATVGNKVTQFVLRAQGQLDAQVTHMGDIPQMNRLLGLINQQIQAFEKGEVDAVYLAYTKFINTMKQEPVIEQLLPIPKKNLQAQELDKKSGAFAWEYIYEPSPQAVIELLLSRYIEALVYQALVENMASEQSARMVAMKSASDNAKNVISELQLEYNKTRQASITKELSEIVSGAAAV